MTRDRAATVLAWTTCAAYVVTAGLHASGYGAVTAVAKQGPPDLRPLVPMLWLAFSAALVLGGATVAVVGRRPARGARAVLLLTAAFPVAAAALQLLYLGVFPPEAVLLADGLLAAATAAALPAPPEG